LAAKTNAVISRSLRASSTTGSWVDAVDVCVAISANIDVQGRVLIDRVLTQPLDPQRLAQSVRDGQEAHALRQPLRVERLG
jgi:hypothetical protein